MRKSFQVCLLSLALLIAAFGQGPKQLKPGFNLFTPEQDVQLGKEAAAQINKELPVVQNEALTSYVTRIASKVWTRPEAGKYPYSIRVVNDKSINAFALPGGPMFVHTGLILAADNEAQIAGVFAHEISHVALRHGTNQASKSSLLQLPAALAGGAVGNGSILGQLAQMGIGLGANSLLLKYSRGAEHDADLLGTRMMAGAGYDPIEMARFFEKLKGEGGTSKAMQFFSDHPDPGNRVKSVEEEIRYLRARPNASLGNPEELRKMQDVVRSLPEPPKRAVQQQKGQAR